MVLLSKPSLYYINNGFYLGVRDYFFAKEF